MYVYGQNYYSKRVRELCHGVKERDSVAINEMADYFLNLEIVTRKSIIIPAPQHEGFAIYTKKIADIIADNAGCKVADILISLPRQTLYEQKLAKSNKPLQFCLKNDIAGNELFFLDNVIDSGVTYQTANRLLQGRLKPLIFASTGKLP